MTIEVPPTPQPQQPNPDDWNLPGTGNYFTEQIRLIRILRLGATVVAVVALCFLLWALTATILSFTKQIDKATPNVNLKELVTAAEKAKAVVSPSSAVAPGSQTTSTAPVGDASAAPGAGVVKPVSLTTAVTVDISSIGNSIVAVVSILVIAIAVLAISLLRTTYTLSVDSVRGKPMGTTSGVDTSFPIPGAELVKAIGEALATVLKGIPNR